MANDVVLDVFQGELAHRNGGESLHPISDGELLGCEFLRHRASNSRAPAKAGDKAILKMRGLLRNYSVIRGRSNEVRSKEAKKQGNLYIAVADALTVSLRSSKDRWNCWANRKKSCANIALHWASRRFAERRFIMRCTPRENLT